MPASMADLPAVEPVGTFLPARGARRTIDPMHGGWKAAAAIAATAALALLSGLDDERPESDQPPTVPDPCWDTPGAAYTCLSRRQG